MGADTSAIRRRASALLPLDAATAAVTTGIWP
jgi:hypothetical protein